MELVFSNLLLLFWGGGGVSIVELQRGQKGMLLVTIPNPLAAHEQPSTSNRPDLVWIVKSFSMVNTKTKKEIPMIPAKLGFRVQGLGFRV